MERPVTAELFSVFTNRALNPADEIFV